MPQQSRASMLVNLCAEPLTPDIRGSQTARDSGSTKPNAVSPASDIIEALRHDNRVLLAEVLRVREALGFYARGQHLSGEWSDWRKAEEPGWLDPPDGDATRALESGALAAEVLKRRPPTTFAEPISTGKRLRFWSRIVVHLLHRFRAKNSSDANASRVTREPMTERNAMAPDAITTRSRRTTAFPNDPFYPAAMELPPAEEIASRFGLSLSEAAHQRARMAEQRVFVNSTYQVNVDLVEAEIGPMLHVSIKRRDKQPMHDWREKQRIKNSILGEEAEAVELYPAESRLVDTPNQYHLWALPLGARFQFGYQARCVDGRSIGGAVQRPFEEVSNGHG